MIAEEKTMQVDVKPGDTREPARDEPPEWFSFPVHERLLKSGALPGVIKKMEETCRNLTLVEHTGTSGEKARARLARAACHHTLELLRALQNDWYKSIPGSNLPVNQSDK